MNFHVFAIVVVAVVFFSTISGNEAASTVAREDDTSALPSAGGSVAAVIDNGTLMTVRLLNQIRYGVDAVFDSITAFLRRRPLEGVQHYSFDVDYTKPHARH